MSADKDKELEESEKRLTAERAIVTLIVESVTGTTFEVQVMAHATVLDVKEHLEIIAGIDSDKQHLVWRSLELQNYRTLYDYGITSGTKVQLVPALQGGPISRRRHVPTDQELSEWLIADNSTTTTQGLGKKKMVAVVVVAGPNQQYHFIQILDGSDDSDDMSDDEDDEMEDEAEIERRREEDRRRSLENMSTREKMLALRQQMHESTLRKQALRGTSRSPSSSPERNHDKLPDSKHSHSSLYRKLPAFHDRKSPDLQLSSEPLKQHILPPISLAERLENVEKSRNGPIASSRKYSGGFTSRRRSKEDGVRERIEEERKERRKSVMLRMPPTGQPLLGTPQTEREKSGVTLESSSRAVQLESKRTRVAVDGTSKSSVTASGMIKNPLKGRRATQEDFIAGVAGNLAEVSSNNTLSADRSLSIEERMLSTDLMHSNSIARRNSPTVRHIDELDSRTSETDLRHIGQPLRAARHIVTADDMAGLVAAGSAAVKRIDIRGIAEDDTDDDEVKADHRKGSSVFLSKPQAVLSGRINSALFTGRLGRSLSYNSGGSSHSSNGMTGSKWGASGSAVRRKWGSGRGSEESGLAIEHRLSSTVAAGLAPETTSITRLPVLNHSTVQQSTVQPVVKRCAVCAKKTGLATSFICKCDRLFCQTHKFPEEHSCTYDYKSEGKRILREQNPEVRPSRGLKKI